MAETVQASQQDGHFNESIVNEEILEDMKKNRIDHMSTFRIWNSWKNLM